MGEQLSTITPENIYNALDIFVNAENKGDILNDPEISALIESAAKDKKIREQLLYEAKAHFSCHAVEIQDFFFGG